MSTRERPNKEKEKEETVDSWLNNSEVKAKSRVIEKTETKIQQTSTPIQKQTPDLKALFLASLPDWVNKPWMYVQPTHEGHLKSWKESWKTMIIDYSSHFKLHIISVVELMDEFPFNNKKVRKQISKKQMDTIIDEMVEQGLAKWIDEHHIVVRVFYKTTEQWKEIMVAYLFDRGYAAEVITFFELKNMEQEWSTLPFDEFFEIFELLVKEGRAKWADTKKDSIKLEII